MEIPGTTISCLRLLTNLDVTAPKYTFQLKLIDKSNVETELFGWIDKNNVLTLGIAFKTKNMVPAVKHGGESIIVKVHFTAAADAWSDPTSNFTNFPQISDN